MVAGLPNDSFSIENGIIMDKARRWPLCTHKGNRWIKKMGQPLLVVAKFTDGDYQRLEGCIQFGNPIENVEETDPALEPVLLQQTKGSALDYKTSCWTSWLKR